jgi:acetyl-CoA synthetase
MSVDGGQLGTAMAAIPFPRRLCDRPGSGPFHPGCPTRADDPAILIYTSGTTGKPKGALHAHRVLLGHLPGVEISHDFLPGAGRPDLDAGRLGLDRRAAGCADAGLVSRRAGAGPPLREVRGAEAAFELMARHGVTCTFLPPTALQDACASCRMHAALRSLALRSVASGGETLGAELT